jgi:eukaryotic-like serine/threonine-protein kinase
VGVVVGTPAYMSPEQCSGRPIDGRSDLYGCGVLLFQLVTGRMPFTGETPFDYAIKHVREPPPPPREFVPAIHPELEATILKALAKDPAQRQSSARELSAQLRRLLPDLATELRPVRGPLTTATRTSSSAATAEMPLPQVPDDEPTAEPRRLASLDAAELDQAITLASRAGAPAAPLPVTPAPGGTPQGVRPESPPPLPPMPSRVTTAVALEPAEPRGRMVAWLLVPVALAIGIAVGVAVFVLTR